MTESTFNSSDNAQTVTEARHVDNTLTNASCAFLALWSPTETLETLSQYAVVMYPASELAAHITVDDNWDLPSATPVTSCNGATCNAAQDKWQSVYNLDPSETYWVLSTWARLSGGSDYQTYGILIQGFMAGAQKRDGLVFTGRQEGRHTNTHLHGPAPANPISVLLLAVLYLPRGACVRYEIMCHGMQINAQS